MTRTQARATSVRINKVLFVRLLLSLFFDLLHCPLQWFLNRYIFPVRDRSTRLNNDDEFDESIENVCVIVHHFAERGLKTTKSISGITHRVGVGTILEQLSGSLADVHCFVADATDEYAEFLKQRFPSTNFVRSSSTKLDFASYLQAGYYASKTSKYYCMFNDNVDLSSDIEGFIRSAKYCIDYSDARMVGVGSNSYLTQSIFKRCFSPHIQTFGFLVEKKCFDEFSQKYRWFLYSWDLKILFKASVCRILEQGLSKFVLKKMFSIAFIQSGEVTFYARRYKCYDTLIDWSGRKGDSRTDEESFIFGPVVKQTLQNENIHNQEKHDD